MTTPSPVIILTGASRGLGLAILRILLEKHNARVTTISRSQPFEFKELVSRYEERVLPITGSVGEIEVNARAVKETVEKWGDKIDGLILNAGMLDPVAKIADIPLSEAPTHIQVNLLSAIYLIQPSLPYLRRSSSSNEGAGKVVFVSSGASTSSYQAWRLFCMVKAGMNSLCRTLHVEESGEGVSSYAVRPGVIDTDMQAYIRQNGPGMMSEKDMNKFNGAFETGSLLKPEQPGAIIAALAVNGPKELSGEYLDWADQRLSSL